MRRWLALAVVGLAVAWGPYVYSEFARKPAKAPAPRHVDTASLFDDSIAQPAAADEQLESQVAAATENPQPAAPEPMPEVPVPHVAVIEPPPAEEPEPAPAEPADKPAAPLFDPAGVSMEHLSALRADFEAQPRDGFWAGEEEPRLQQLIHDVGVPEGVVSELSCRKTVCRAIFASLDVDKEIEQKLYARLREVYDPRLGLDVRELEGGGKAALYVLRKGYELEAHAATADQLHQPDERPTTTPN